MMFSTIYRASQHKDLQKLEQVKLEYQIGRGLDLTQVNESTHTSSPTLYSLSVPSSPLTLPKVRPDVSLSDWMFFSFKPYVFPKDLQGREVNAPMWFKYLGRALIGLIIAIFTYEATQYLETDHGLLLDLIGC